MACEREQHLVELAEKLADHYRDQIEKADHHLQDLLEAIPGACQHVGIPKPSQWSPSSDGETYFLRRPIRFGPRRELDEACFDAVQAYYQFRMFDMYRHMMHWIKADEMLGRFKKSLEDCEHANKGV
jgi:hypothetical protein